MAKKEDEDFLAAAQHARKMFDKLNDYQDDCFAGEITVNEVRMSFIMKVARALNISVFDKRFEAMDDYQIMLDYYILYSAPRTKEQLESKKIEQMSPLELAELSKNKELPNDFKEIPEEDFLDRAFKAFEK